MKRFWLPLLLLVAGCWGAVARDDAARRATIRAWNSPYASRWASQSLEFEHEIEARWPTDARVRLDALAGAVRDFSLLRRPGPAKERAWLRQIELQARGLQLDPPVIALLLRANLMALYSDRRNGPIYNRNFPAPRPKPAKPYPAPSPRAAWNRVAFLARRGQELEPRNTFFRWMRIWGLLATHQDAAARAELRLAARETRYDDHNRDLILNRIALMRQLYGAPLSPRDLDASLQIVAFPEAWRISTVAYWTMETVVLDRAAGRHRAALETSLNLVRLGRTLRTQSQFYEAVSLGVWVETIAMARASMPTPNRAPPFPADYRAPLKTYQANRFSLYRYAKAQHRTDIARFVSAEWPQLARLNVVYFPHFRAPYERFQRGLPLVLAERARSLLLRILPSIALLGALFWALSWRYNDDSGARKRGFGFGAGYGLLALLLAVEADTLLIILPTQNLPSPNITIWLLPQGLLSSLPLWVWLAPTFGVILMTLEAAANWQKHEVEPKLTLKFAVEALLQGPADGAPTAGLAPLFSLVATQTGMALLGLAFLSPIILLAPTFASLERERAPVALMLSAMALGMVLGCLIRSWRRRPRRRATLRLAARMVSEALVAFAVVLSLIYTALVFVPQPYARSVEGTFQLEMQRGPMGAARLAIARARLQRQSAAASGAQANQ